jgi:trans-aconitate 2-methyltransferase
MTSDWNADRYHEISMPQQTWGRRVLDRVELKGTERALDLGCGTGRLTAVLAERLPDGDVIGLDRSSSMLTTAAAWLRSNAPHRVQLVMADGAALPFVEAFDQVFSAATFHWIHDHAALFRSIALALRPGGRLHAQCGGRGNLARLYERADRLMRQPGSRADLSGWSDPVYFADVEHTRHRLEDAGLEVEDVGLEEAPTRLDASEQYKEFIATVCLRHHLNRLPVEDRAPFMDAIVTAAASDTPPFTLDYWRLNISARKPA